MPGIPILHEDEHVLVVDKPAGLLVVPAPGRSGPTVVDLVSAQLGHRVQAVHRLALGRRGELFHGRARRAFGQQLVDRVLVVTLFQGGGPFGGLFLGRLRGVV